MSLMMLTSPHKNMPRLFSVAATAVLISALPCLSHSADAFRIGDSGYIGVGIDTPVRQLHLQGANATFRMDRDANSSAFILVRTAPSDFNTVWKTFVVGANADGANNGSFVINDLGTEVAGGGSNRMTIDNTGDVYFTGNLYAKNVNQTSSLQYKTDIETLTQASDILARLRGVRFNWKDDGNPSIGLIAEEVAEVLPEVVQRDAQTNQAQALNYSALTAVLIEAVKDLQAQVHAQQQALETYQAAMAMSQAQVVQLEQRIASVESLQAKLAESESLPVASHVDLPSQRLVHSD